MKRILFLTILVLLSVIGFAQKKQDVTARNITAKYVVSDSLEVNFGIRSITGIYNLLKIDSVLTINDYTMPKHKGDAGHVLTMSATGDSVFWGSSGALIDTATFAYASDNASHLQGLDTATLLNRYWNRTNDSITTSYKAITNNGITNTGNLISTNGNFFGLNNGWYCGYDTLFEGALKMAGVGKIKGSFLTGTYRMNGFAYIENKDITFFGFDRKVGGVAIKQSNVRADSNTLEISRFVNNRILRITLSDTAIITEIPSKMIMSADSGAKHIKIYIPTIINNNLTVHGIITSGGLVNKDTVVTLVDDATFNFPNNSVGFAEIQCDSVLTEKTWGNVSWNGDGSINPIRNNGAKFVSTNTDGNEVCFYDGGTYAILKNRSGYTRTYSIKYHYHY